MRKLGIGIGAAAVCCTIAIWGVHPPPSSQSLLKAAQAEFAVKAREAASIRGFPLHPAQDAVGIARLPPVPAEQPLAEMLVEPPKLIQTAANLELLDATTKVQDTPNVELSIMTAEVDGGTVAPTIRSLAGASESKPAVLSDVSPASQAQIAEPEVAPSVVSPVQQAPRSATITADAAARSNAIRTKKTRPASRPSLDDSMRHHLVSNPSPADIRRGLEAFRAHAPEIAAIVASYM